MYIKICGITNEEDALSAVAVGATALGFIFVSGSKRQISVEHAKDIIKRLPKGFTTVGVFKNETKEKIIRTCNTANIKIAQIHGSFLEEDFEYIRKRLTKVIWSRTQEEMLITNTISKYVDYIMLDSNEPGSGEIFDWSNASQPLYKKVILAGGLTPENVAIAIDSLQPWGVDVATGVEEDGTSVGKKDVSKMRRFCDSATKAFKNLGDVEPNNEVIEVLQDAYYDTDLFDWAND